jgi:hypothetical protein
MKREIRRKRDGEKKRKKIKANKGTRKLICVLYIVRTADDLGFEKAKTVFVFCTSVVIETHDGSSCDFCLPQCSLPKIPSHVTLLKYAYARNESRVFSYSMCPNSLLLLLILNVIVCKGQ